MPYSFFNRISFLLGISFFTLAHIAPLAAAFWDYRTVITRVDTPAGAADELGNGRVVGYIFGRRTIGDIGT